jgi:hypothetical protein
MEPNHSAEIGFGLAIMLQTPEHGTPEDQKLGLVRSTPESLGQNVHRLVRLFQPIQQPGEMQTSLDMTGLELEQLTVGPNGLSRKWPGGKPIRLLQSTLGLAAVPWGRRRSLGGFWLRANRCS